jgi:uncharacterized protein (TIGR02271 family)
MSLLIGGIFMSILDGIFGKDDDVKQKTADDTAKIRLRKEVLDIDKRNVEKGDVEISKEIIEEHKTVDIPLRHEEVVIERRTINNEVSDTPITDEETIRIPVREERVDVTKHTVVVGEVTAHKSVIENTAHIDETLKREEVRVNKVGISNVADSSKNEH